MDLTAWGKYPNIDSRIIRPRRTKDVLSAIAEGASDYLIARGLGRSYGDSSLAPEVISTELLDHYLDFDAGSGILTCSAGVSLEGILREFVPRGWFLPVTPGTKFVTVGGAIASDVHGKNHHLEGSFSDHVISMKIATASKGVLECSRQNHPELFFATCGGMGLTGIILEATFRLISIQSAYINETTIKARNLQDAMELFEAHQQTTYSVAWIDCLSTGKSLGRSLLMLGEHAPQGALIPGKKAKLSVPMDMPGFVLNRFSIQAFNILYYNRVRRRQSERRIHYEPFFYPLDGIHDWNRMYGRGGFTQYQFVLPREAGLKGMTSILKRIASSKRGSFLAVLKSFGKGNANYISFPMEGYTLALDFKLNRGLFEFLDELDRIVLDYGGRLYLTKDVRMSEELFKASYPQWEDFMNIRTKYHGRRVFNSLQSRRLGL